jgi:uncharacterized membrane protein YhaH (DUF805 family)
MGSLLHYLFSFEGRISRTKWWLGQLVFVALVLGWLIISVGPSEFSPMVFGGVIIENAPHDNTPYELRPSIGFEKIQAPAESADTGAEPQNRFWLGFLILAWPYCWIWMAVTAKRLHDLGMSGWWGVPGFAPTMFYGLVFVLSNGFTDWEMLLWLGPLVFISTWVQRIAGAWLFSQCGMRKGSPETNQYGPPDSAASHGNGTPDTVKSFDREDQAIRAAIARMSAPPAAPLAEFASAPQKTVFGRRS